MEKVMTKEEQKSRDGILLNFMDECIDEAPNMGICPLVFKTAKDEILRIMDERDNR